MHDHKCMGCETLFPQWTQPCWLAQHIRQRLQRRRLSQLHHQVNTMKRLFSALILAVCATVAQANVTITLTPEQAAALAKSQDPAATVTSTAENVSATMRKEASAWGEMGANMGKALVGAAKEVGVAANEFAQTPLGKVTVAIVAYKIVGQDILAVVFGGTVMVFGLSLALWFLLTNRFYDRKFETKPTLFGLVNRHYVTEVKTDSDTFVGKLMGAAVSAAVGLVVGLTIIF